MQRSVTPIRPTITNRVRAFRWLVVALLAAALVAGSILYGTKVFKECVASGESTLWCVSTLRLQSWKQLWG